MKKLFLLLQLFSIHLAFSQYSSHTDQISASADKIEPKVIQWRQDFHQNPELGNRETRTAGIVAKHLKSLGMEVKTGVAITGVVGILRGAKPG